MKVNPTMTRIFWTSGDDGLDAANQMGHTRPVCDRAITAHEYVKPGEALFRITIESFTLDDEAVMSTYLMALGGNEGEELLNRAAAKGTEGSE